MLESSVINLRQRFNAVSFLVVTTSGAVPKMAFILPSVFSPAVQEKRISNPESGKIIKIGVEPRPSPPV